MANHEKQKRLGFINFYKFSTKKHLPKSEPTIVTKKPISHNIDFLPNVETVHEASRRRIDKGGGGGGEGGGGNLVEARKSVSHVETNLASVAKFLQVKVLVSDMPGFMQVHAFRCARRTYDSLEKFSSKHMAYNIKKEFDRVYGPAWHCIVGSSFGSFVTHSTGCFLYFSMEKHYILVFRTKVQKTLS